MFMHWKNQGYAYTENNLNVNWKRGNMHPSAMFFERKSSFDLAFRRLKSRFVRIHDINFLISSSSNNALCVSKFVESYCLFVYNEEKKHNGDQILQKKNAEKFRLQMDAFSSEATKQAEIFVELNDMRLSGLYIVIKT